MSRSIPKGRNSVTLSQGCQTGGPRAKSGPQWFRKWPTRDLRILTVLVESQINSECMQVIDKNCQNSVEKSEILRPLGA